MGKPSQQLHFTNAYMCHQASMWWKIWYFVRMSPAGLSSHQLISKSDEALWTPNQADLLQAKIRSIFNFFCMVTSFGDQDLNQCRLSIPVDTKLLPEPESMAIYSINLRAIPQEMLNTHVLDISLKITNLRLQQNHPATDESTDRIVE